MHRTPTRRHRDPPAKPAPELERRSEKRARFSGAIRLSRPIGRRRRISGRFDPTSSGSGTVPKPGARAVQRFPASLSGSFSCFSRFPSFMQAGRRTSDLARRSDYRSRLIGPAAARDNASASSRHVSAAMTVPRTSIAWRDLRQDRSWGSHPRSKTAAAKRRNERIYSARAAPRRGCNHSGRGRGTPAVRNRRRLSRCGMKSARG